VVCGGEAQSMVVDISISSGRVLLGAMWTARTYLFCDDESLFMRDGES
jgi:hypothetical protein